MLNNKVVMCGCHESGWNTIKYLLEKGIRFEYFVTITKEKALQLKVSGYKSFEDLAEQYKIPIYYVRKYSMKSDEDMMFFEKNSFDLLVQGGWQRLFPDMILQTLSIGAIGGHGSAEFLPKGRGRSPVNWSLIEGKRRFIMHYFLIKPGIDDGDIFHFEMFDINDWDTCRTLYYKISLVSQKIMERFIPILLTRKYQTNPQIGTPTYYPKRTAEDGLIIWSKTVFEIFNFIRALTHPYPGAFSYLDGKQIKIWKAQPFDTRLCYPQSQEGEIIATFDTGDFVVKCNSGLLLVTEYDFVGEINSAKTFSSVS